jgi:arsenite methyltransferase
VGPAGRVIGVDMTPEMIARANANKATLGFDHVEFRQGQIEQLPVDTGSVDVIMSNCVINLVPEKKAAFREAFRVLGPGGRLAISDIVAIGEIPVAIANDPAAYTGCVSGAAPVAEVERLLVEAGFTDVRITLRGDSASLLADWSPGAERIVASALIEAVKPAEAACCAPAALERCCSPAHKAVCCEGAAADASCGCQGGDL